MKSYRFWLVAAFIGYVVMDLVRRFFSGTKAGLLLFDAGLGAAYLAFLLSGKRPKLSSSSFGRALIPAMALFVILILGELLNPSPFATYAVTKVFGVRNYLFALPCIWIGYQLVTNERDKLDRAANLFFWVFAIVSLFGIAGFFLRSGAQSDGVTDVLTPMADHKTHSFEKGEQLLSSSFFATSARFAVFLLGSYLLLWSFAKEQGRPVWYVNALALGGLYVSGSRTAFTLFMVFSGLSFVLFRKRDRGPPSKQAVAGALSLGAAAVVVLVFWGDITRTFTAPGDYDYRTRSDYLLQGRDEYVDRSRMALSPLFIKPDNPDLAFGVGVGTYGQETFAVPLLNEAKYILVIRFFYEKPGLPLADSGLTKVMIELGIVGLLVVSMFFLIIVFFSAACIWRSALRGDAFGFAFGFFPLIWVLLFMKGHQTMADLGGQAFFYLSVGFVAAVTREHAIQPEPRRLPSLEGAEVTT